MKTRNKFIIGSILSLSLQAKGFDCVKNAQEIGKIALYSEMLKDFIQDAASIKEKIDELKKQKETLDEIKKQNEEIIKLLSK
jgi:uncharacterized protein YydD (DUF2326 family)